MTFGAAAIRTPLATLTVLLLAGFARAAQPNTNFIELAHVDPYPQYNDCWGYKDPNTGVEYAILGTTTGTSVWNVSDPFHPYETGFVASTGATPNHWRDLDIFGQNLYVTTEGSSGGLQIISLANPEAPVQINKKHTFTAHTLWIDQAAAVAYCMGVGSGAAQGFRSYNLAVNPSDPTLLAEFGTRYFHDAYTRNGTLYGAAIFDNGHVDILRVSNLPAISTKGTLVYPNGFTHNCWTSDDGQTLFTTDEKLGTGTVKVWDVSDTSSVVQIGQFPTWTNTCVHNVYVKNDTAYCSWYEEGVLAFDVTNPATPVQIGSFDTGPDTVAIGNYAGCWAVYPFLPSGVIVSSDIKQGMHLLYYADAIGTISGTVTNAVTLAPIAGAQVAITDFFNRRVLTDSLGHYSVIVPGGTHSAVGSKPGFASETEMVSVTNGATTTRDFALDPVVTAVAPGAAGSDRVVLEAPSPNPARGSASFAMRLPRGGAVALDLFDTTGRRVRTIASGTYPAGRHAFAWDGRDDAGRQVASGAFVLRLEAGGTTHSAKLFLSR